MNIKVNDDSVSPAKFINFGRDGDWRMRLEIEGYDAPATKLILNLNASESRELIATYLGLDDEGIHALMTIVKQLGANERLAGGAA